MRNRWLLALLVAPLCSAVPMAFEAYSLYWEALEADRSTRGPDEEDRSAWPDRTAKTRDARRG
jgi:hypothetical protein